MVIGTIGLVAPTVFLPVGAYSLCRIFALTTSMRCIVCDVAVVNFRFPDFVIFGNLMFIDDTLNCFSEPLVGLLFLWEGFPCGHVVFEPRVILDLLQVLNAQDIRIRGKDL